MKQPPKAAFSGRRSPRGSLERHTEATLPTEPLSVSRLGRRFGLSRSALLYYDRIGLLSPSERSGAGYRLYGARDVKRLAAICRYREVGLDLVRIGALLDGPRSQGASARNTAGILEARLQQLGEEIERLREQQRVIVRLLEQPAQLRRVRSRGPGDRHAMDKARWVAILRATGLDDAAMQRWHVEFERMAPQGHRDFLRSLGLSEAEVARIRRRSRPTSAPVQAR